MWEAGAEIEEEPQTPQPIAARLDWPKARSGQAMTYAPSSGLIFLFGGYDQFYMNDLWTLSLGRTDFPSLTDITIKAVKKQHGAKTDELPIPEDVKHRLRYADIGKQMEWREECLGAAHATQNPSLPLRTTAGICVVDRALYMFGGSQGSPDNSDIYKYDLGEGAARQWSKLEVSGATPKPSNYSKLAVWGTHIVAINDENMKDNPQDTDSFHIFDTTTAEWKGYKCSAALQAFENVSVGIAFGHLCFVSPDATKLFYMALDDLVATTERPAGSERLEWKALDLERGDPAMNPTVTCWAGPYLFGASDDRLGVLVIDLAKGSGRWQPITLVGEPLKIADSGATMCGSPSRLVVFGGYSANTGYSQATTVLDVTDLEVAQVTNL